MHPTTHSPNQQNSRGPSRRRWHGWQLASPYPNGITNPHQSINPKSTSSPHPHTCSRSKWIAVCSIELLIQKYRTRDYLSSPRRTCSSSSHCASRRRSPLRQAEDGAATACEARIKPPDRGNGPPPAREARCRPPRSSRDCLRRR